MRGAFGRRVTFLLTSISSAGVAGTASDPSQPDQRRVAPALLRVGSRLEDFTRTERQRKCSDEDKAQIVAELAASVDSVCSVVRRHALPPHQLFGWRRQ
ncbi:transposase [Bradyrhizobium sp. CIR3A]|uniref:transposase n=1 Tax=Bradyrhizobium sp. CIR3A TaxID=2663838 RepID=UPI001606CD3B|nr:transposase [Bradyrhizobium sp. CIR3A]